MLAIPLPLCCWTIAVMLPLLAPISLLAAEAKVAVASNFTAPMKVIAQDFERDTGHKLVLSFGATGQFYAQIRHGAPYAVLLAADDETPQKLELEGWGVPATRFTYAIGRLVLWSQRPGWVDDKGEVLRSGVFEKIAIANPKLAPYGAAALEVLDKMGVRERIRPKTVEGANITQTFQFVASGNAPLGFVALSQVQDNGAIRTGSAWIIPSSMHSPIRQDALVLKPGQNHPAANALIQYLKGDRARAVMRAFGYE